MMYEYRTAEEAAIPDCEATVPPATIDGDDPCKLAEEAVLSSIEVQPALVCGTSTHEVSVAMMLVANLRYLIDQVLKESLTDNWSVEAFFASLRSAIDRSLNNYNNLEKIRETLEGHVGKLKIMEHVDTPLVKEVSRVSRELNLPRNSFDAHIDEIRTLQNDCTRLSVFEKLHNEFTAFKDHQAILLSGIHSRLNLLEEIQRMDNVARGSTNDSILNAARMEGFQACALYFANMGCFPRHLLHDHTFTDLLVDKHEIAWAIIEADNRHVRSSYNSRSYMEVESSREQFSPNSTDSSDRYGQDECRHAD